MVLLLLAIQVTFTNPCRELFLGFVTIKLEFLDILKFERPSALLEFIGCPRIFPKISQRIVMEALALFGMHCISSCPPSGMVYCQAFVPFAEKILKLLE